MTEVVPDRLSKFGGQIRCVNVLRALEQIATVEVMVLNDQNKSNGMSSEGDGEFNVKYSFDLQPKSNKGLVQQLEWTFNPHRNYPNGCGVEYPILCNVLESMKDFELIWFFKLRSADMFPNTVWHRSIVDIDDLPSTYERAALNATTRITERLLSARRLFAWRRREKLLGKRFSVLTVCSDEDKQYLKRIGVDVSIQVIPNGFEKPPTQPSHNPVTPPRIGFLGLFEYFPNREGMKWFIDECWQQVKSAVPNARLRLVGQGSEEFARNLGLDIDGLGWLRDTSEEIRSWSAMIVPIRIGGGTRIKIAYGYSRKCPIVSTSYGAYGYEATDQRQLYLADSALEFADACIKAICNPEQAARLAETAWREFQEKWTWDAIRPRIWAAVDDCLRKGVERQT